MRKKKEELAKFEECQPGTYEVWFRDRNQDRQYLTQAEAYLRFNDPEKFGIAGMKRVVKRNVK